MFIYFTKLVRILSAQARTDSDDDSLWCHKRVPINLSLRHSLEIVNVSVHMHASYTIVYVVARGPRKSIFFRILTIIENLCRVCLHFSILTIAPTFFLIGNYKIINID